jgi:hypothetical protein
MLPFRSIRLLNSSFLSKFCIQRARVRPNFTYSKPFSTVFLPCLASSMDPSSNRSEDPSTTDHSQEELPVSQPASPTQSPSEDDYSWVTSVDEIAKGVVHLQCESSAEEGVCQVYLVGTAHVSQVCAIIFQF